MKKNNLILLSSIMLMSIVSCNKVETSESNSTSVSESISSKEESSISLSSSLIDESKFTAHRFMNVKDELYLLPDEVYHLSKMVNKDDENTKLTYLTNHPALNVSEDGVLTGKSIDSEKVSGDLYIVDETRFQKITVNVVDYNEYGNYFTSVDLGRLYHKNVVFFGDSITHNWAKYPSGNKPVTPEEIKQSQIDSLGYPGHYIPQLHKQCEFTSITNAAWSGGTMAWLPKSQERFTYKSFIGSIKENEEAVKKADIMFVFYGTNDLSDQVDVGTLADRAVIDDKTNETFVGSMSYGIQLIQQLNPQANIVFFNLLTRTYPYTGKYTINDYCNAIENACRSYMLKMINIQNLFEVTEFNGNYSNDGLHLNDNGYKVLVDYILSGQNNENN